jgi:hypothetical protein
MADHSPFDDLSKKSQALLSQQGVNSYTLIKMMTILALLAIATFFAFLFY